MQKPQIPIFMEITDAEWEEMVRLLCLREKKFKKNTIIFHQGDITEEMGIVIKGNVNIENVDISGNVSLLGNAEAGDVFAETYALCGEAMAVDAVATSETVILFLPMKQLMHEKNAGYSWYGKMQANIGLISCKTFYKKLYCYDTRNDKLKQTLNKWCSCPEKHIKSTAMLTSHIVNIAPFVLDSFRFHIFIIHRHKLFV